MLTSLNDSMTDDWWVFMLAAFAHAPDFDDPLAALTVGERPTPAAREGWKELSVAAASLNMHDVWTLKGVGIAPELFPMILGMDASGHLSDGTPAVVYPVLNEADWRGDETLDPRRTLLTEQVQGTLAERVALPAANLVPIPPGITLEDAAVLGTAWLTAYRMLFTKARLRPGQAMLVQGASGGVSTALIQLGRAAGFRVWATGRTSAKRAFAEEMGAHGVFEPGVRLPERVHAVFESVGEATWGHSMRSLRPGGALICCGATTGINPGADLARLISLQIRVEGSTMGTREEFIDLLAFVSTHGIRPHIGMKVPLSEARSGFATMIAGEARGKILVDVDGAAPN